MKRVLVTGATGFIGRHLIDHLVEMGLVVRALVRNVSSRTPWVQNVEMVCGEVQDHREMQRAMGDIDTVFHLAGRAHQFSEMQGHDSAYCAVNVEGTRNVLEAAVVCGVERVVFFSSVKAMGEHASTCLNEAAVVQPVTSYGKSKLAAEKLVIDYGRRAGFHAVCLRLPLVYGVGNKGNLFRMIVAIDRGLFLPIPGIGNYRSMVHVSNVVDAAILAATKVQANGQCYIVTDHDPYSTREIYERICGSLGKRVPRWYVPISVLKVLGYVGDVLGRVRRRRFMFDSQALDKLIGSAWYSSERISRELGYHPSVTFHEALPELIHWYRKASV